jgi:hypothetical protein
MLLHELPVDAPLMGDMAELHGIPHLERERPKHWRYGSHRNFDLFLRR